MRRALFLLALLAACGGRLVYDAGDVDAGAGVVDPCSVGPGCISAPDAGPSPK